MDINVLISNPDFFADLLTLEKVDGIYVEEERITPSRYRQMVQKAHDAGKHMFLALPYVWNEDVEKSLDRNISQYSLAEGDGFLIRNLDELGILAAKNAEGLKILDQGMYTWNKTAMDELASIGADIFTAPYELNRGELMARGFKNTEVVVYGHYPMMVSNNCIKLTTDKCVKTASINIAKKEIAKNVAKEKPKTTLQINSQISSQNIKGAYAVTTLTDRKGANFPVVNRCRYCYNIIYNSVPTWLLDEKEVYAGESVRFNFTIESRMQMLNILENYFKGNVVPPTQITRGHYKRGAE